jgi:hypothetical protein
MFVPTTIVELGALMTGLEADPSVKVVVFQSDLIPARQSSATHINLAPANFWIWQLAASDSDLRLPATQLHRMLKSEAGQQCGQPRCHSRLF